MATVQIDNATFKKRVHHLQRKLGSEPALFNSAQSVVVIMGKPDEENLYRKSSSLHTWLLGYEFTSTAIAITKQKVIIITSAAKVKHLEPLKSNDVLIWTRSKDPEHNRKLFDDFLKEVVAAGSTFGMLPKDVYEGAFVTEWTEAFEAFKKDNSITEVDVSGGLANSMSIKDEEELRNIRLAAKATSKLMSGYFADKMSTIIDEDKKITHSKLAEQVEDKIDDEKHFREMRLPDLDPQQLEWCYTPIIQSGGKYDLKPSAMSDDSKLTPGVILCSLGLRYKSYCSNVSRTFLVDPTADQDANYSILLATQKHVISQIKEGVLCKDVYNSAVEFLKSKKPGLEQHLLKNVGWGIGLEFRDSSALLSPKNSSPLKDGMTVNVVVGLADVKDKSGGKPYGLLLADTVRVGFDKSVVFSDADKENVSYYFKQDGDDDKVDDDDMDIVAQAKSTRSSAILKSKLRNEAREKEDESAEKRRQLNQKDLHEKLQKVGMEKYADESEAGNAEIKPVFKRFESYKRDSQLPVASVKDLRITVDAKSQTILIPINGRPVPFHINTYKNGSKNDEGEFVYLRLNFHSPGSGSAKKDEIPFEDPGAQFLRSITLRSRDTDRMNDVFKRISDLKKEALKRESERKELEDVVQQDKLIEMRKERPKRLDSVFVRPGPEGKRVAGTLEIHQNGIRYQSPLGSDQKIDLLFSNMQHLFFQPCDQELIVVIHVHLKNPIMVGKKKTQDVQFYREASDMAFDETGNRKRRYRYGDEDELEQEQEERRRRKALNLEFKNFSERISEQSGRANRHIDVDTPIRELGFNGVPFRSNVLCQPTTDCLVQLIDPPFLVVTLQDVELAHLERVQFGLKQFDLVFIFKDYNRPVVHINSIPMDQLDGVKDWLNEMDIAYYEGPVNLSWPSIMKTVAADPHEFFAGGGWSFLSLEDGDDSDQEEESEESDFAPSDFNPSDEEEEEEEEESEEEYSDESGSEEELSEEGEDWDELDAKAQREDKQKEDRKRKR
uniref:FACT complex subunit n=1 Tax=Blastobotrys adeninivorans TaxID=409370 RepID=A0A060T472_BLAAD